MIEDQSSRRERWAFDYLVSHVLEAAKRRYDYHTQRDAFWRGRFDALRAKLGDSVDVRNMEAFGKSTSVSNYNRPSVEINPELQRDLTQAITKTIEHRDKAREYGRWLAVLGQRDQNRQLSLTMADVEYFSVADSIEQERLAEQSELQEP